MRRANLGALVRVLHTVGPLSRSELGERTGLTRSGIRRLVGDLVDAGLAVEAPGSSAGQIGRPSPVVALSPERAVVLALEISVDSLAMAVVAIGGEVLDHARVERTGRRAGDGAIPVDDVVAELVALADRSAAVWRTPGLVGVGVAVVGVVRRDDGFVSTAPNLGWRDVPLGRELRDALGTEAPIVIANEADLGALAEHRRGAAAGAEDVVLLWGEVGLGGGLIVGGRPLTGVAGYAGEVGHLPVNPVEGAGCRCGAVGCWETEVGEEALLTRAGLPADGGRAAVDAVLSAAARGDGTAIAALSEVGRWLGIGLAGLVNALSPSRVVLGGRFALAYPYLRAAIDVELDRRALAAPRWHVEVVAAQLGTDAPLLGAAELVFEPVLNDPAGWVRTRRSVRTRGAGRSTTTGGMSTMHTSSRRGTPRRQGEETRMHARRTAALFASAALLIAACGDDDDDDDAASTETEAPSEATEGGGATTPAATEAAGTAAPGTGGGDGCTVGVSWNNYNEERWAKWDEPAIQAAIDAGGGTYISNDAESSAETQASNVENLISQGAQALIILAQDGTAILPSVQAAISQGIPVIAYDRLIDDPGALYITFDNVLVGQMEAEAILEVVSEGNFAIIKGNAADANADFLRQGFTNAGIPAEGESSDTITIVGEEYTDNWEASIAQTTMEQFLTQNDNDIDAVLVQNDGMAGGVIAALEAQGLAGEIPVSGQDAEQAALNRVALGTQTVTVWKDARELGTAAGEAAMQLCANADLASVADTAPFTSPGGNELTSILLEPIPITQDNLDLVLEAGWIDEATLCDGVEAGSVAACP